jgi:hypothetical protein
MTIELGDDLRKAWRRDDDNVAPIDEFANLLGGIKGVAKSLMSRYTAGEAQRRLTKYLKLKERVKDGEGNKTACQIGRQIADQAGVELDGC